MGILSHLRAILLLPFVSTVVIPCAVILTGFAGPGWSVGWLLRWIPLALGGGFVLIGLVLMVKTVRLFATVGEGTLAPWEPTQRLVVRGIYRHVRNPMITGVSCILLGEAVALGSVILLGWFLSFSVANVIYIPLVEETGLERRFGEDYLAYRQNVPRWVPRLRPWRTEIADAPSGSTGASPTDP